MAHFGVLCPRWTEVWSGDLRVSPRTSPLQMAHSDDDGATVPRRFGFACSGHISHYEAVVIQFDELICNSEAFQEPESINGGGPNVAYDSFPTPLSAILMEQTVGMTSLSSDPKIMRTDRRPRRRCVIDPHRPRKYVHNTWIRRRTNNGSAPLFVREERLRQIALRQ